MTLQKIYFEMDGVLANFNEEGKNSPSLVWEMNCH